MNQFRLIHITEQLLDGIRALADDFLRFRRTVIGQTTRYLGTIRRQAHHHLATPETALHAAHAHRQQALAALAQRLDRSFIELQRTTRLQMAGQPLLACRQQATLGGQ